MPANATDSGETLWNNEGGSRDYNDGAKPLARGINRGYIDGNLTTYLNLDLIAAITPNLPWPTVGLILVNPPWSGWYAVDWYAVDEDTLALAHATQFTAPGWKYLDRSSGFIDGNRHNGSYVSPKSPNSTDYARSSRPWTPAAVHRAGARVARLCAVGPPMRSWRAGSARRTGLQRHAADRPDALADPVHQPLSLAEPIEPGRRLRGHLAPYVDAGSPPRSPRSCRSGLIKSSLIKPSTCTNVERATRIELA